MTAQDVILEGYGLSRKNTPGEIASTAGELVPMLNRQLAGYFSDAARINRAFFGKRLAVPFAAGGWARPADAEHVYRIVAGAGVVAVGGQPLAVEQKIGVVSFDQPWADSMRPSVYEFGQVFYSAGNTLDPASGALTFMYSRIPARLTALSSVIDPAWPDRYRSLLVLDTGIYLARKDGNREDEVANLRSEHEREMARFTRFLEHATTGEGTAYGQPHVEVTPATRVVPE